ncbi:MAG: hypothetical protein WCA98_00775 [Candidatus Acidiferrales bacterium]
MRKLLFVAAILWCTSFSARAQSAEVFGGYSYEHLGLNGASANLNGWNLSLNYKPTSIIGIVSDFDGTYGSPSTGSTSVHTYLFGPQFTYPGRISPFFHVLFGGGHLNIAGATDNCFTTGLGGGVDFKAAPHISIRAFEYDEVFTRFLGSTQSNPRISIGVVVHF